MNICWGEGKMPGEKVTVRTLAARKEAGEKITMLTAYDYAMARILDEAGIDILLVGDSLGMVVLGYPNTLAVTMEDMIRHTQAVARGAQRALVVADMPFLSYQVSREDAIRNAGRLVQEGNAAMVKLEGGEEILPAVEGILAAGIPVMGHLGLTPQSLHKMGGFRVQGKDPAGAKRLLREAQALSAAGVSAIVLEGIPADLAQQITANVSVPTIGIGAGARCDGQVLVTYDLLGIPDTVPKFVKQYARLQPTILAAARRYRDEVKEGTFPAPEHTYA